MRAAVIAATSPASSSSSSSASSMPSLRAVAMALRAVSASAQVSPHVSSTVDALVALSRDASTRLPASARHAELLARALALTRRRHSISAPTHARATLLEALADVDAVLTALSFSKDEDDHEPEEEQAQATSDADDGTKQQQKEKEQTPAASLSEKEQRVLATGLASLWTNVLAYALLVALSDLLTAVDFIPHALRFWKAQRRRPWRAALQTHPRDWLLPASKQFTLDERIYSLESTLNASLITMGKLKAMIMKLTTSEDSDGDAADLVRDAISVLAMAYSSSAIAPPRRGEGAFKTMEALHFSTVPFEPSALSSINSQAIEPSLQALHTNLARFHMAREQYMACVHTALAPCRVPSKLQQRWLHVSVAVASVVTGGVWVARNQREFQAGLTAAKLAFQDFFSEHMIEPMQAIVGEVLLNQKPEIQDAAALADTKDSLKRMLTDFVRDTDPQALERAETQRILEQLDMSVVSLQYEKQLGSAVRNLMTGDIVRMLLIQVQFIKKELMVAMGAIDELMHANQLNLQIMATVPTFLVLGGAYKLTKEAIYQVYKRTSERLFYDPAEVAGFLRNILRDIERLLNKQAASHARGGGGNEIKNEHGGGGQGLDDVAMLNAHDTGLLMLLLHQLRDVFESHRELFAEDEQERFDEDVNDLLEDAQPQLAVIQRMYHTHPFLQHTRQSSRWRLLQ